MLGSFVSASSAADIENIEKHIQRQFCLVAVFYGLYA